MSKHNMGQDSYCTESQLQLKDTLSVCFLAILWVCWCLFCLCVCQVEQWNCEFSHLQSILWLNRAVVICFPTRDRAADPQLTVAKQPTEPFPAHELPQQLTLTEEYNSASKHRQLLHTLFLWLCIPLNTGISIMYLAALKIKFDNHISMHQNRV